MVVAIFVVLVVLMAINVPIAISTGLAAIFGFAVVGSIDLTIMVQRMLMGVNSFTLIAIPLFILAGRFMQLGGITTDLINLSKSLVGFLRGGLAYVNIVSSMFFAGITGSAASDSSSVGSILIPAMVKKGYHRDFSVAVTATSSTIGVMIPPSIPMVIYGVAAGVSIGQLFLGGIIPGILVAIALMAVTAVIAKKRNYPVEEMITLREAGMNIIRGIPALLTIIIIIGGIVTGIFTATEAAGIAALYSFLLGVFYYKELKIKDLPKIMLDVSVTTGMVALMIATASALGYLFAIEGIPQTIANALLSVTENPFLIMLMIMVLLLFIGTFLDLSPAVIIFTPILLPIVTAIGIDPVHFGVIMVVNLAIGLFTPPVGVCLFVSCAIGEISITDVIKAILPYFMAMIVVLLIITYIPELVMFLPETFMR
ncbi:TRAP transporter large permease [Desertibacillus haloalkaliphilus]|uniref:TRAP transporter large permease n=1 Tax=Desertibacillus haloalkaliphilus TaxID=1328930 RepID=UPI001C2767F4|nr:TRAP transporter large permease [Desertibacillus haloalkaliphilus]MBU8907685.1 TRAP transporter large permease [Desertibacillus haloalkaliphilus]